MKLCYLYMIMCVFGLLALAGCREDAVLPDEQGNAQGKTLLVLDFTIEGHSAASRTVEDDSPEHPAADWEDNIAFFHLFIKHADETWETPIIFTTIGDALRYEIEMEQSDLSQETFYLGANLSTEQAMAFISQQQEKDKGETMSPYTFTKNNFDLITDFSPYSTYDGRVDRNHIAMFCTEGKKPTLVNQGAEDEKQHTYTVSFDLKRMVAKVLVTCKTDVNGYATVKDGDNTGFEGWIRQTDVKYIVNGLNRKAYIMQQVDNTVTDAYANVLDPNNDLQQSAAGENFFFQQLEGEVENEFFRTSSVFDTDRLSTTNVNYTGDQPYTEGIYCPENTFAAVPNITLEGEQTQVTHVNVAARFTPKNLYIEEGLKVYIAADQTVPADVRDEISNLTETNGMVVCPTEAVASQLLASSLKMAEDRNGFPSKTYFYQSEGKTFYTYGAMCEALGHKASADDIETNPGVFGEFVPYLDGWGYYYTYVDNRLDNYGKLAETDAYQYGQVERNRYYILNITGFTQPGSSITNPNYILVHTYSFPWKDGGSGSTELNPEDEVRE